MRTGAWVILIAEAFGCEKSLAMQIQGASVPKLKRQCSPLPKERTVEKSRPNAKLMLLVLCGKIIKAQNVPGGPDSDLPSQVTKQKTFPVFA